MLSLRNVSLTIKGKRLLSNMTYDFEDGKVYGILGPNGAGKTTMLKTMIGLADNSGEVLSNGRAAHPNEFGSLIEYPAFYPRLTAYENLVVHTRYRGIGNSGIEDALAEVGLSQARNLQARKMSLGMRQRLGIARACLGSPRYLLLDEPTNGLDPMGIKGVRGLLQGGLRQPGRCILVSSHNLGEVAAVADELVFVREGQIAAVSPDLKDTSALESLYECVFSDTVEGEIR